MTSNPITIGGETLSAEDIPTDPRYFALINRWAFLVPESMSYGNTAIELEFMPELWRPIIAAVARCYFLDKAEEIGQKRMMEPDGTEEDDKLWSIQCSYLASAAKWARIGKGCR